ncbi:MAG: putative ABC transporter permease [Anaerovoracaceae bacterium]
MRRIFEYTIVFLLGATAYSMLEILFRGFTHWTMFIAGGLCFSVLYHVFNKNRSLSLLKCCLIGAAVITGIEFLFGLIFNLVLGWNVWDYSHYPLHFMGQICLAYTLLWFLLSAPIYWITKRLKKRMTRRYL